MKKIPLEDLLKKSKNKKITELIFTVGRHHKIIPYYINNEIKYFSPRAHFTKGKMIKPCSYKDCYGCAHSCPETTLIAVASLYSGKLKHLTLNNEPIFFIMPLFSKWSSSFLEGLVESPSVLEWSQDTKKWSCSHEEINQDLFSKNSDILKTNFDVFSEKWLKGKINNEK